MSKFTTQLNLLSREIEQIKSTIAQINDNPSADYSLSNLPTLITDINTKNLQALSTKVDIIHKNIRHLVEQDFVGNTIYEYQFCYCKNLVSAVLSNQIDNIMPYCFKECNRLDKLTLNTPPPQLDNINSFEGTNNFLNILVPVDSYYQYMQHPNWQQLKHKINCTPSDDTIMYLNIFDNNNLTIEICLQKEGSNTLVVDWGDNTQSTNSANGVQIFSHTYNSVGIYKLKIISNNAKYYLGSDNNRFFIDEQNFTKQYLIALFMGKNIIEVKKSAFRGCSNLVTLYYNVEGTSALSEKFMECSNLSNIIFGNIVRIGGLDFYGSNIRHIRLPDTINIIGNYSITLCNSLVSVVLPKNVTTLFDGIWGQCPNLKRLYLRSTTPPALIGVLYSSQYNVSVYIPKGSLQAYSNATNWAEYQNKFIEYDMENYIYD